MSPFQYDWKGPAESKSGVKEGGKVTDKMNLLKKLRRSRLIEKNQMRGLNANEKIC
jgi:hypothetical protein